jgi:hypothetical protein
MAKREISDEALVAFVQWCRINEEPLVTDPLTARRVFRAYRLSAPTPAAEEES